MYYCIIVTGINMRYSPSNLLFSFHSLAFSLFCCFLICLAFFPLSFSWLQLFSSHPLLSFQRLPFLDACCLPKRMQYQTLPCPLRLLIPYSLGQLFSFHQQIYARE